MQINNYLPKESFLTFDANVVSQARLLWHNDKHPLIADFDWRSACFARPISGEIGATYGERAIPMLAERYGGEGIGKNGGGARCGLTDGFCVKGVGPNGLGATDTDYWHRYGGATLSEGVKEAVWGEVFNNILPHGAIRVLAIIATGSLIDFQSPWGVISAPRVLIIRDKSLRPAHYMRAVGFKASGISCDSLRTKLAVGNLWTALSDIYFGGALRWQCAELLNRGLQAIADRFASQLAVSRINRLFHGALNSSNICLDGKWIDFGTASSTSDFGRIIVARGTPDQVYQHMSISQSLAQFSFYIRKNVSANIGSRLMLTDELISCFNSALLKQERTAIIRLLGLEKTSQEQLWNPELHDLVKALERVATEAKYKPFKLDMVRNNKMPPRMAEFSLVDLYKNIARWDDNAVLVKTLEHDGISKKIIDIILPAYTALKAKLDEYAQTHQEFFVEARQNAIRRNTSIPELYRCSFDRRAVDLAPDEIEISEFIKTQIAATRHLWIERNTNA